jgi:hypothetical protein
MSALVYLLFLVDSSLTTDVQSVARESSMVGSNCSVIWSSLSNFVTLKSG